MKILTGLLVAALVGCFGYWLWRSLRRLAERNEAAELRAASFLAEAKGSAGAVKAGPAIQEQLLHDAATKAAAAGEPALSIQLYARLLSRFPQSSLAAQARSAVEQQKKRLATPTAPGPAGPG